MLAFLRALAVATLVANCALAQPCSVDECADVLILGAGMAGVAAARTLHVNGITNYIVLEANAKIGGRIRRDNTKGIELGANWIHGLDMKDRNRHPLWREWLRCDKGEPEGSETPMDETMIIRFDNIYNESGDPYDIVSKSAGYQRRRAHYELAEHRAEKFSKRASEDKSLKYGLMCGGWDPDDLNDSLRQSLDPGFTLGQFIEWNKIDYCTGVGPESLSLIHHFPEDDTYEAFLGEDMKSNSSCYLITDKKGYSFVVDCLAEDFLNTNLKLNATVTEVETTDDSVCVAVQDKKKYCASYAILTFSMGVLQAAIRGDANAVTFTPKLPKELEDAINNVTVIHFVKIFLQFNEPFWDESEKHQQFIGYASETRGNFPVFFTVKSIPNTIHVHVTEDLALRVQKQDKETTTNEIMAILRQIYKGKVIQDPISIEISDWSFDPLFYGSYETYGPGVPRDIFKTLSKPVNNRLYLAGSALNDSHFGYVHGAYGSGVCVAKQIADKRKGLSQCKLYLQSMNSYNGMCM